MNVDKKQLIKLICDWAQSHNQNYDITKCEYDENDLLKTASHLSWVVREEETNINLMSLLHRLEFLFSKTTGLNCKSCNVYFEFAESNQDDGTLICYSCRNNPYV